MYILIGSGISAALAVSSSVAAALTARLRGQSKENPTERNTLLAAALFIGLGIIFFVSTIILALYSLSARCKNKKKAKVLFIISFILLFICVVTGAVILAVYRNRLNKEGRTDEAVALNTALGLVAASSGLFLLAFILLLVALRRKLKRTKCKQYVRN